jgi:hypothetical protein
MISVLRISIIMMRQVLVLLFLLIIGFALGTNKNNYVIAKSNLAPMVQKHVQNFTSLSEQLLATHTLLKQENKEMKWTLSDRKERKTGKHHVKNKNIISTEEVYDNLKAAENVTVAKKKGSKKRKLSTSGEAET